MEIKNILDFEKTIKYDELAKSNDWNKFLLKSYLDILLKGGKLKQSCFLYGVGKVIGVPIIEGRLTIFELEKQIKHFPLEVMYEFMDVKFKIMKIFKKMCHEKKWTDELEEIQDYDENGKEIDWVELNVPDVDDNGNVTEKPRPIISKTVTTKITTEYFLDDKIEITPFKNKIHGDDLSGRPLKC